jgi:hypothetical protein
MAIDCGRFAQNGAAVRFCLTVPCDLEVTVAL